MKNIKAGNTFFGKVHNQFDEKDKNNQEMTDRVRVYPGRVICKGEQETKIVKAVQTRLNLKGCGPLEKTGIFDEKTFSAVKLFQARFSDINGNPLIIDGLIGPITWETLFGNNSVQKKVEISSNFIKRVLEIAAAEVGTSEDPSGSNSGEKVNEYLSSVGLNSGNAWCAAFVYWCFQKASDELNIENPLYKTGLCSAHWDNSTAKKISADSAIQDPSLILPGHIFITITDKEEGTGHTGIVESVNGGFINTLEGNTSNGVNRRQQKISYVNLGFLQYS